MVTPVRFAPDCTPMLLYDGLGHTTFRFAIGCHHCEVVRFFTLLLKFSQLLIPKHELTPRSISTPRFQPMSSYPLYSSLMFRHSQAPISVAIKHLAQLRSLLAIHSQPRHHSSSAGHVLFPQTVTGWPPLTLSAYTPW